MPVYDPNTNYRDSQQRLVTPRINVSMLPTSVSVTTGITLLPANVRSNRIFIWVQNVGSVPVYIGDSSVTAVDGAGYRLNPFSDVIIPCNDSSQIYAIATQSCTVCVLEGL